MPERRKRNWTRATWNSGLSTRLMVKTLVEVLPSTWMYSAAVGNPLCTKQIEPETATCGNRSGLHIPTNGREFADLLEALITCWPVPVEELAIIGHSMGGLLARSAWHYGNAAGHDWSRHLNKLVFLGTPHHGAPLERGGNWVDIVLGASPYTAPFARLGRIRSAGITDLRHGYLLDEDWEGREPQ